MHAWALILFFHVGPLGEGNSNATSVVHGFTSRELCEKAATQVKPLANGSTKVVRSVCVQTQ